MRNKTLFILISIVMLIRVLLAYSYEMFYKNIDFAIITEFANSIMFWILSGILSIFFYNHFKHKYQKLFALSLIAILMFFESMYVSHSISVLFITDFWRGFAIIYAPVLITTILKTTRLCLQNLRQAIGLHSLDY